MNFVQFNGIFNELTNHKKGIRGEERQPGVQWGVQDHLPAQGEQPVLVWKQSWGSKVGIASNLTIQPQPTGILGTKLSDPPLCQVKFKLNAVSEYWAREPCALGCAMTWSPD